MSNSSYQPEMPKARIHLQLDLQAGGASKKTERPLNGGGRHGRQFVAGLSDAISASLRQVQG